MLRPRFPFTARSGLIRKAIKNREKTDKKPHLVSWSIFTWFLMALGIDFWSQNGLKIDAQWDEKSIGHLIDILVGFSELFEMGNRCLYRCFVCGCLVSLFYDVVSSCTCAHLIFPNKTNMFLMILCEAMVEWVDPTSCFAAMYLVSSASSCSSISKSDWWSKFEVENRGKSS